MSVVNPAGTFINGPDGKLEAKYVQGKSSTAPTVLILHPHPEYGGTMNNKVVLVRVKVNLIMVRENCQMRQQF